MYLIDIHIGVIPFIALFVLPSLLHHSLLPYPATVRRLTPLIVASLFLIPLVFHSNHVAQWLLTGAAYLPAMKLLIATHFYTLHASPLYTHSSAAVTNTDKQQKQQQQTAQLPAQTASSWLSTSSAQSAGLSPIPFLAFFIFLFTANAASPVAPSQQRSGPSQLVSSSLSDVLLKYVALHVAVGLHLLLSPASAPVTSASLLSISSPGQLLHTWAVCAVYCLVLYSVMSMIASATFALWRLLYPSFNPAPLFYSPWLASSPRSFWSQRWNRLFTRQFHQLLFHPINSAYSTPSPSPSSASSSSSAASSRPLVAAAAALSVFALSGLLHLHHSLCANHRFYPETFLFFLLNGVLCCLQVLVGWRDADSRDKSVVEAGWQAVLRRRDWRGWLEWLCSISVLVMSTALFWPPYVDADFVGAVSHLLLLPVAGTSRS